MKEGLSDLPQEGNLGGAGADRQIDSARKLAKGVPPKSILSDLLESESETESIFKNAEIIISPTFHKSWNHPQGAKLLGKEIIERMPDLRGYRFITFTLDRNKFNGPLDGFNRGGKRIRKVFHAVRKGQMWEGELYKINAPYCRKLELHKDGWPHWHCVLKSTEFIPNSLLRKLWSFGIIDVQKIESDEFNYLLKYLVKDPSAELPDWYLSLNKVRPFYPTKGFLKPKEKEAITASKRKRPKKPRMSYTIKERLENWEKQVTLKTTKNDVTQYRHVQLDEPFKNKASNHLIHYASRGKYLGDLKFQLQNTSDLWDWF